MTSRYPDLVWTSRYMTPRYPDLVWTSRYMTPRYPDLVWTSRYKVVAPNYVFFKVVLQT